jgi:hypothetical protein
MKGVLTKVGRRFASLACTTISSLNLIVLFYCSENVMLRKGEERCLCQLVKTLLPYRISVTSYRRPGGRKTNKPMHRKDTTTSFSEKNKGDCS